MRGRRDVAKTLQKFNGEVYYLDNIYTFKREADEEKQFKEERGYDAKVKNVAEGWAVYYK